MKSAQLEQLSDATTAAFITEHLPLASAPTLPQILIHQATPASRLGRISEDGSPYWAWCWPGGLALAHHILANLHLVKARRVLDLGTGSGLVAIAAAKAGASDVIAVDISPSSIIAATLNAEANAVTLDCLCLDILDLEPLEVDLVTVGDLFYDQQLASRLHACLARYQAKGICVLIGDPDRAYLPKPLLVQLAAYNVPDFGNSGPLSTKESAVYTLRQPCSDSAS